MSAIHPKESETRCACHGQTLDRFVQPVMLSIISREPMTGYAVIKNMKRYPSFADGAPDTAGAYRYLKILEQRGLISRNDPSDDSGRIAPTYSITDEGEACLSDWVVTLRQYSDMVRALADEIARVDV